MFLRFHNLFTFENRCMVCQAKLEDGRSYHQARHQHIERHIAEGYVERFGDDYWIKRKHPLGWETADKN
jgi:hypothetical protein